MTGAIRAHRIAAAEAARLLEPGAPGWARCRSQAVALAPAPVAMVAAVSPYVAASAGHGKVPRLEARAAHDGTALWLRLSWPDATRDDRIADLDRFADAAAALFPIAPGADPFRMGAPGKPVNAWLWRADGTGPFDVLAEGYATSQRRPARSSGLAASAHHDDRGWSLVFQRPLTATNHACVTLAPGTPAQIAFAVWDGSNRDRSAQKAVSPGLLTLEIEA